MKNHKTVRYTRSGFFLSSLRTFMIRCIRIYYGAALLSVTVFCLFPAEGRAADNKKYLHKTTIDTLIQQAFVNLNAASEGMPGADFQRRQALVDARRVSAKLRTMARGDPNERYVLWKTGELESQILLEERDIVLKKLEIAQKEKNAIVDVFNAEVGKKRPDFVILKKTIDDMKAWDGSKAWEMESSTEQRSVNISREVVYTLEKAMIIGDLEKTQREFDYCKKNRALLKIPVDKFDRFDSRIQSLAEAIKLKPAVDEQFSFADGFLPRTMLKEAGKCLREIQGMLARMDRDLPPKNREEYYAKAKKIARMINQKEDSLIAITYSILAAKGENEALEQLERVVKPCGVSETKIGQVQTSIMNVATIKSKAGDTTLSREMKALSQNGEQQAGVDFDLVRSVAKKKAQERADSARAAEQDRAQQQQTSDEDLRRNQEKANQVIVQIYDMLEKNQIEAAYKRFTRVRTPLAKYLCAEAFTMLETTVVQSYDSYVKRR